MGHVELSVCARTRGSRNHRRIGSRAKALKIGQRVGVGWTASSCLSCPQCLSGNHNLCANSQGVIVGRFGGFAERLRVQWTWARPIPEDLDVAKTGPLLCGGVTVFSPFTAYNVSPTARVGVIGIGGLGHMAVQFASKWGCEVHAFTTSDSKEQEAHKLGARFVHNTKKDGVLKKLAGQFDLILSTINVPLNVPGFVKALAPKGRLHLLGAVLEPMQVPAMPIMFGHKSLSGSPVGSPTAIDRMLEFSARHSVAPVVEAFPMSKVNDALEHLRAGKARYRIVLDADF
jgi:alcohol/geraniol dehydrogenase (NADP+)